MESAVKSFLASFGVIVVMFGGLLYYHYSTIHFLEEQTHALITNLTQQVTEQFTTISQQAATVSERLDVFEQLLQTTQNESQKQFSELTGKLTTIQEESTEKLSDLEHQLKLVNVEGTDFSGIIKEVIPSVVSIRTDKGSGSGSIVDDLGYIVTNYHVVKGATAAAVRTYEGERYPVRLIDYDARHDIAVLKMIANKTFDRMGYGDATALSVGDKVIALGNPGGLDFTVTQGIVSAKDREAVNRVKYIQHDVPINPGNSGGPLVDGTGKMVGINTGKISGFEGVGFALPINTALSFIKSTIRSDKGIVDD